MALFARHATAPNLLMAVMLLLGFAAMQRLHTQFFPDIKSEAIGIAIGWPGASAEDVDLNIIRAVERELGLIDGVDEVTTTAYAGSGHIAVAFRSGADMQKALADAETAVSQVTTLPQGSERPMIRRMQRYDTVSRLLLSGPYPEFALRQIAKRLRDDLLARGIDKVELGGARRPEIVVEAAPAMLERLGLDLTTLSTRISEATRDLPAGVLDGLDGQRRVRSMGREESVKELEQIEIRILEDGSAVRLREVAQVSEQFAAHRPTLIRNGHPAIELNVQQPVGADLVGSSEIVDQWLATTRANLPPQLKFSSSKLAPY